MTPTTIDHRCPVCTVCAPPAEVWRFEGVVSEDETDIDEGLRDGTNGRRSHYWSDATCWLHTLAGKRVRLTVEVLP